MVKSIGVNDPVSCKIDPVYRSPEQATVSNTSFSLEAFSPDWCLLSYDFKAKDHLTFLGDLEDDPGNFLP